MTIRFDSNNNNSEWMEEIQMLVRDNTFHFIFNVSNNFYERNMC
ncbi:hypothetical protein ID0616_14280 [Helicobacter pylori]